MNDFHIPVLKNEAIEALNVKRGGKYIDATIGGGGHSFEILKRGGIVLGIDVDEEAIEHVKKILRDKDIKILSEKEDKELNISVSEYPNITLVHGNFRNLGEIARSKDFLQVDGILFDLGVSSYQLSIPSRGFSFQKESSLDMRMDKSLKVTAKDLINGLTKGELYELFTKLGEEKFALAISNRIVRARQIKPIETTMELARLTKSVYGRRTLGVNPATRVFQALRIAVNDELNSLKDAMPKALDLLGSDGRLVVISFHSLEDRVVKNSFKEFDLNGKVRVLTKKPIRPSPREILVNPRARSAKMRVIEKL